MFRAYREIFAVPGAPGMVIAGFAGRISIATIGLGVVLLISGLTGSYGLAGAVASVEALAYAVASPRLARLVDRYGQSTVLLPQTVLLTVAVSVLTVAAMSEWPRWTLFAAAAVTGISVPPLGSLVRARWNHLLGGTARLQTAFSFESVIDEALFITGPILVTALATALHPAAGLGVAAVVSVSGTIAFALQRRTQPPARGVRHADARSALFAPGMPVLVCVFLGLGMLFATIDITTVAFAEEQGAKSAAGPLLAAYALGSCLSGVLYGARTWVWSLDKRFALSLGLIAAGALPPVLVHSIPVMAVVVFLAGFAISPTAISGYALVRERVPESALTEGMAWVSTSVGVGIAVGSPMAGRVVDAYGAHAGYAFGLVAALFAALVGIVGTVRRRPDAAQPGAG